MTHLVTLQANNSQAQNNNFGLAVNNAFYEYPYMENKGLPCHLGSAEIFHPHDELPNQSKRNYL
jgi:hypothetical protein